jgi:hypothetical protein
MALIGYVSLNARPLAVITRICVTFSIYSLRRNLITKCFTALLYILSSVFCVFIKFPAVQVPRYFLFTETCLGHLQLPGAVASDKQNLTCVRLAHHDDVRWGGSGERAKSKFRHSNVVKASKCVSGRIGFWNKAQRHTQLTFTVLLFEWYEMVISLLSLFKEKINKAYEIT